MKVNKRRSTGWLSWKALFGLWSLQGALAIWWLASLPADATGGPLLGFSAARLSGVALLVVWTIFTGGMAFRAGRDRAWTKQKLDGLFASGAGDALMVALLVAALAAQTGLGILAALARGVPGSDYAAYAGRLAPIFDLVTLTAIEFISWMAYGRRKALRDVHVCGTDLLRRAAITSGALAVVALFIARTGLGIVPDETGDWGLPAVALLEWQILLAGLVSLVILLMEGSGRLDEKRRIDVVISAAIWLGTAALWLSQPIRPAFSALPPRAPNFEVYPFFDAQVYDEHAQSILVGNGMQGTEIPSRPLYIVFLALLHLVAGQEYERVIAAQTLVLAFFPVVLYWIGKELHGRPVGAAMALLAALRDVTSNIAAPFTYALTYSKLYLSELPVAVPLVLFILTSLWWARRKHPALLAFLAGGILGVAILIRTQAVVALPVVVLTAWLTDRHRPTAILRGTIVMTAVIALVVTPWVWRNWKNTGQFIFDSPQTQTINLALRYNALNGVAVDVSRGAGEDNAQYNKRLVRLFREAVAANPGGAARVLTNRFLNNCVDNLLLFPLRNNLVNLEELWQPSRSFWEQWRGRPTAAQGAVLAFYAGLLGLGMAAIWKRSGLWAFAPLGINLLYHLWTSVALLSGQRFLVSMDWSISMYYMAGLFTLMSGFLLLLQKTRPRVQRWYARPFPDVPRDAMRPASWRQYAAAGLVFFLIGASIPLSEMVFPRRYGPVSQSQLIEQFLSSPALGKSGLRADCVQSLVRTRGLIAANGSALSPRFYDAGEGEQTAKLGYAESNEARLVFLTTGNRYGLAVLNMDEPPAFFPHGSDVIVFTDPESSHEVWFVLAQNGEQEAIYASEEALSEPLCRAEAAAQN